MLVNKYFILDAGIKIFWLSFDLKIDLLIPADWGIFFACCKIYFVYIAKFN